MNLAGEDSDFGMQLVIKVLMLYLPRACELCIYKHRGGFRTKQNELGRMMKLSKTPDCYVISNNAQNKQNLGYKTILFFKYTSINQ
jgi:hypothetical protein